MQEDLCQGGSKIGFIAVPVIRVFRVVFMADLASGESGTFLTQDMPIVQGVF